MTLKSFALPASPHYTSPSYESGTAARAQNKHVGQEPGERAPAFFQKHGSPSLLGRHRCACWPTCWSATISPANAQKAGKVRKTWAAIDNALGPRPPIHAPLTDLPINQWTRQPASDYARQKIEERACASATSLDPNAEDPKMQAAAWIIRGDSQTGYCGQSPCPLPGRHRYPAGI